MDTRTDTGSAADQPAAVSKFQLGGLVEAFDRVADLSEYVGPLIKADKLWGALVSAVRALGVSPPARHPPRGVILSSHPLIGLAAAAALIGDVGVPLRRGEAPLSRDGLGATLAADRSAAVWLSSLERLPAEGSALLMRAWDQKYPTLAAEVARGLPTSRVGGQRGLVCMLQPDQAAGFAEAEELPILIDVAASGQPLEIVLGAIITLGLPHPSADMAPQQLQGFLEEYGAAPILQALNSEDHHVFNDLTWQYVLRERPFASKRRSLIISDDETTPRHAASLFVAAHFPYAPPGAFFALADMLASLAPTRQPGQNSPRDPEEVSDAVLRACGIRFARTLAGALRPVIGSEAATDGEQGQEEAEKMTATIATIFDKDAALLRERYLQMLANWLTLGHPSEAIAARYQTMEISALAAAAAAEPEAARERLRRIVFGYPVSVHAGRDFLDSNRREFKRRLQRSVRRAPSMLAEIASRLPHFQQKDAVAALCVAEPIDKDKRWTEDFHTAAAALFWQCYLDSPQQVTLDGYPAFFGRGGMTAAAAIVRRKAALRALRVAFDGSRDEPMLDQIHGRMGDGGAVVQVLNDVASATGRLVDSATEPFGSTLLGELCAQFLLRGLRGKAWAAAPTGLDDTALVRALTLVRWLKDWLNTGRRTALHAAWDDAVDDEGVRYDTLDKEARRYHAGHRTWLNCLLVLDALLGLRSLDAPDEASPSTEPGAWNIFLVSQLYPGKPQSLDQISTYDFADSAPWEWLCADGAVPPPWRDDDAPRFQNMVAELSLLFPLFLLIASVRGQAGDPSGMPGFSFSEGLRSLLLCSTRPAGRSAVEEALLATGEQPCGPSLVEELLRIIDIGRRMQNEFRQAVNRWQIATPYLPQWQAMLRDREATLAAFQRALRPLVRDLRISQPTAVGGAGQTASSKTESLTNVAARPGASTA